MNRPHNGDYKGWPLYACAQLDRVAAYHTKALADIVGDRHAWLAASLTQAAAILSLGWRWREFDAGVAERGITPGRFGRYAWADIVTLAADEALGERVEAERLIGPDQAADRLEIRRTDWNYLVAAGLVVARRYTYLRVGRSREVTVPLYRTADVDALRDRPDLDWEAARGCRPGTPSVFRHLAPRRPTRARVIRRLVAELGDRFGVEVWAYYHPGADRWELDWTRTDTGEPTAAQVTVVITGNPVTAGYIDDIELGTESGAATRWARHMLTPGVAVILDTVIHTRVVVSTHGRLNVALRLAAA